MSTPKLIKIGVSACLLGKHVRYDGGHRHDRYITETLGRFFSFVPVCPEVGCGLPIPRESMRLEGDPAAPRLMTNKTRIDLTEQMQAYCRSKVVELEKNELCGFIFKKNSPSCGLFRIEVHNSVKGINYGRGLFSAAIASRFPQLPIGEEDRLNDPNVMKEFIERIYSYQNMKYHT